MSNNYLIYFFVLGIAILTLFAVSLIIMLFRYKQNSIKHKNNLLHTRIEAQEQSMKLISEEIHDNVGQLLSLSRIHTQSLLQKDLPKDLKKTATNLYQLITDAVSELRFISHSLNGERMAEVGLHSSIQRELEYLQASLSIRTKFIIKGAGDNNTEQALLLFRIIQEVIQNLIKHSGASLFILIFKYLPDSLVIDIKDNGKGFDVEETLKKGSLGMRNIQNRVRLMKGTIAYSSKENYGTKINIRIPKDYGEKNKNSFSRRS